MPTPCQYDPEEWFIEPDIRNLAADEKPVPDAARRLKHAIHLCFTACPVRLECLDLGLREENLQYGVYGGYTPRQRQAIVAGLEERRAARRRVQDEE